MLGPAACSSPAPGHVISCHWPPALTAPDSRPPCLNGDCVVGACGPDPAALLGPGGAPPTPGEPPPRLGRTQQLSVLALCSKELWVLGRRGAEGRRWGRWPPPPLRGPQPPGGAGGGLGRDPAPGPAQAWGSVKPHPVLQVYPGRHRGFHLAGPVKPARWAGGAEAGAVGGGEGAGCTPGFLPTSCLPSRGTRTTAPTSSAGPPAPAPPGRSASGGTPRPHGRPSTAAAQVLGPSVSSAPDEAAPLAFPLTSLSLVCDGSDGCWDVGAPGGDREPVRLPHLEVSLAPCREALCRGSR